MNENVYNWTILESLQLLLVLRDLVFYFLCWVWLFDFLFNLAISDDSIKFNLSRAFICYAINMYLFLDDGSMLVYCNLARQKPKNFQS